MKYNPPKINNDSQWVPIVVKNKDWLIGYITGIQMIESLLIDSLEENGINIDLRGFDLCLDSSRFNDIMEDGKRESCCSDEEIREYYKEIINEKISIVEEQHPDNNEQIFSDCFLEVECVCGLGIYIFKNASEIPEEPFKCQICGRTIIDYTGYDDENFEYDGKNDKRIEMITDELKKKYEEIENNEEDEDDEDF
jgi:ribosomal protein S27E